MKNARATYVMTDWNGVSVPSEVSFDLIGSNGNDDDEDDNDDDSFAGEETWREAERRKARKMRRIFEKRFPRPTQSALLDLSRYRRVFLTHRRHKFNTEDVSEPLDIFPTAPDTRRRDRTVRNDAPL